MNELSLFDTLFGNGMPIPTMEHRPVFIPTVDVIQTNDGYELDMDLPGKTENDINIDVDHNTLKISSKKPEKPANPEECKKEHKEHPYFLINERRPNRFFERSFILPDDVNTNEISASMKNGVLTINMPKKEKTEPKRIAIAAA